MKDSLLVTQEWCDLVFEGRKHDYGAYELRAAQGRRYRRALMLMMELFFIMTNVIIIREGIFAYETYKGLVAAMEDIKEMTILKDPEAKYVATGRRAQMGARPDAVRETPDIGEDRELIISSLGIAGPDDSAEYFETAVADLAIDHTKYDPTLDAEGVHVIKTDVIDGKPEFIEGGDRGFIQWMDKQIAYPKSAINAKLEGEIEICFVVDTEGHVVDVELTKKSSSALLNGEVMKAMSLMQKVVLWRPGVINGRPVCCKVCLPVHFQLQ